MDDRSRCPAQEPLELAFGCGPSDAILFGALDAPENAPGGCGALCAWDAESGERLYSLDFRGCAHVGCVHVASAGDSFLVGAADGSIRQLDARDGACVFRYSTGMGDVNMVSLSCDGTYVQAAGDGASAVILDRRRPDRAVHTLVHDAPQMGSHVNGVSAQWCHAARSTLVTGWDDCLVRIWDVALGEPLLAKLQVTATTSMMIMMMMVGDDVMMVVTMMTVTPGPLVAGELGGHLGRRRRGRERRRRGQGAPQIATEPR